MFLEKSSDAQTAKKNLLGNSSLGIEYVLAGDEVTAAGFGDPFVSSLLFFPLKVTYITIRATTTRKFLVPLPHQI